MLTAEPPSATANGVDTVTLTATARDASGAPLSGMVAKFAVTGASTLRPSPPPPADGVATVTLRSTAAGKKEVAVSIDGVAVTAHATATEPTEAGTMRVRHFVAGAHRERKRSRRNLCAKTVAQRMLQYGV
jgi:hypothetical protein